MGTGVSFKGGENVLKLITVMVTQLCEYQLHGTVYFEGANRTAYELYFDKAVT